MRLTISKHTVFRLIVLIFLISVLLSAHGLSQTNQSKPLEAVQIESLVKIPTPDDALAGEILQRGVDFTVTEEFLRKIQPKKAYPKTIEALKIKSKVSAPLIGESELTAKKVKVLIADFYNTSGQDRAITQNIADKLNQLDTKTDAEIVILRIKVGTADEARKLGEKEKADIVLWGWYATSNTTAQISANFEFISKIPSISSLKPPGPQQIPINEMDNFSFQVKIGEEYSALVLLTLGLISEERDDSEQAIKYYTKALNLKGLSKEMSFHLLRQRGATLFDLASNREIILETESLSDLQAALAIKPDDFSTIYIIGLINYARGNLEEGINNLKSALSRCDDPDFKIQILIKLFGLYASNDDEANQKQSLESILSESVNIKNLDDRNFYLGIGHLLLKNYNESRTYLEEALKLSDNADNKAVAYLLIAVTYGAESEMTEDSEIEKVLSNKAEDYLKLTIETAPNRPGFYQTYGNLKYSEKNYEKALENFSRAIALRPKFQLFYIDRAVTYEALKNYAAALKDFDKAVEIDFKSISAHRAKALFHKRRKEFPQALSELDICLSIEKRAEFYSYKAEVYEEEKDYRNARNQALQAVKLEPLFSGQYFELINKYQTLETNKVSLAAVENLLASEHSPYLLMEKSFLILSALKKNSTYRETSEYKAVVDNLEQAFALVKTDPDYANPLHSYNICAITSRIYYDENDHSNRLTMLSKCLERLAVLKVDDDKLAEFYNYRGVSYQAIGKNDEAIKDFSTAISYLKDPTYYRNRAISFREKRMFTEALSDLKSAISYNPTDSELYKVRALTYEKMKDFENARRDLLRIISLNPEIYQSYSNYFKKARSFRREISFDENLKLLDKLFEEFKSPYLIIEKGFLYDDAISEKSRSADKNYKNALVEFDRAFAFTLATSEFKNQNYIYGVCRIVTDEFIAQNDFDIGIKYSDSCIQELEKIKCGCTSIGDIYNNRGVLFYESGNFDKAIESFSKALEKQKDPVFFHNIADSYYSKKIFNEALNNINLAISGDANNVSFYLLRSYIFRDMGELNKAISDMKTAIEKEFNEDSKAEYQKQLDELLDKAKQPKNDKLPLN